MTYEPVKRVTTAGRPAAHTQKFPLIYERLRSLRSLCNDWDALPETVLTGPSFKVFKKDIKEALGSYSVPSLEVLSRLFTHKYRPAIELP